MSCDPTAGKALTLAVGARPGASPSITALTAQNDELQAAIRVAQRMLAAYGDSSGFTEFGYAQAHGALAESLRILLRALGSEAAQSRKVKETRADLPAQNEWVTGSTVVADLPQSHYSRCPAAHPEDPTPCGGPVVVTILDAHNAGAHGCEWHGARLLASLDGGRVYALPDAPDGAAIRTFKAAGSLRPYAWVERGEQP